MKPRPRSPYLDNVKGLLIILVVLAHCLGLLASRHESLYALYQLIYMFHMPGFIWISGYLSEPNVLSRKGARGMLSVLWAYLLFNTVNYVWAAWVQEGTIAGIDPLKILIQPSYALWFLLALAWWRLMLPLFSIGTSRSSAVGAIVAASVVAIGSGYVLPVGAWMTVSRVFVFLPFFVAGYRAKQQGWRVSPTRWSRVGAIAAFVSVYLALYVGDAIRNFQLLLHAKTFVETGRMTLGSGLSRAGLLVVSAVLIFAFLQLVPRSRMPFTPLGGTTLSVYLWHAFARRNMHEFNLDPIFLGSVPTMLLTVAAMVIVFGFGPIPRATLAITGMGRWRKGA